MLEPKDIQKLTEVLANKGDIQILREDVIELREEIAELKVTVSNLVTITDRLIGRVELLHQEYLVLKERDTRYERWFMEIAQKIGITLTP